MQCGLYTMLSLPMLCGIYDNNGGSGGNIKHYIAQSCGRGPEGWVPNQEVGAQRIVLIRAHKPINKTTSRMGQYAVCSRMTLQAAPAAARARGALAFTRYCFTLRPLCMHQSSFYCPPHLHCPHGCNTIAQYSTPSDPPFVYHTPYNSVHSIIV